MDIYKLGWNNKRKNPQEKFLVKESLLTVA